MTADPRTPRSRRILIRVMPVVFRVVNVPMRLVLGLPISTPLGKRLMLVYLAGRKTGRHYRQPISYVRDGETLLTPGGGRWKLNLVERQPAHVRIRGRHLPPPRVAARAGRGRAPARRHERQEPHGRPV